ncbi:MAG: leucine-rich repeat protein [Firmicutes bacterium]|nr:leucine-rich repeat protein [Bacillota bacterium]
MKKALFLIIISCFVLFLNGCDLFSKTTSESVTTLETTETTQPTTVTDTTSISTTSITNTTDTTTTQPITTLPATTTTTTSAIHTISFESNGGTQVEPIVQAESTVIVEPASPTREGYVFSGWYLDIESVDLYEFDLMPSNDMVLYADWATEDLVFTLINDDLEYEVSLQDAEDLLSIQIPKYHEGKPVTKIADYGFGGCYSVTEIVYSPNINSIGIYAFMGCEELTEYTISQYITEVGTALFMGCSKLEAINVDSNNLFYKSIEGVLFSISEELLITYPSAKSDTSYIINNNVLSIEPYAFTKSMYLTNVTIGNQVTIIKTHAFYNCWELTSIIIPDQVTTIELYAFRNCVGLLEVTIGSGLTGIDAYVFNQCSSLQTITIPSNIEYIGYGAFYDCTSLSTIIIDKTSSQGVITGGLFMFTNTKSYLAIYVPDLETKNAYDIAYIWSSYASKISVNPA